MASSAQPITIPSSLFDVYQEYKASTATVLTWLCSHEAITPQSGLTVNSLQRAAENIRSKDILVPAMIYRAFRDSVAKRQKVTTWFTSAELSAAGNTSGSTLKHVHFTEKLQNAFSTLFPNGNPTPPRRQPSKAEDEDTIENLSNRFGILESLESDRTQDLLAEEDGDASHYQQATMPKNAALPTSEMTTLEDDPLDALIQIHLTLRELDSICETVKSFWEQVSIGTLPLPFAAWLTNAAYESAKRLCVSIMDIDKDAQEHQDVYIGLVNQFNLIFMSCPIECKYDDFSQGRGMTFPWIAIVAFKDGWSSDYQARSGNHWQDPINYISPAYTQGDDSGYLSNDLQSYKAILASMGELLMKEKDSRRQPGFTPTDINPLLSDLSVFLDSEDVHPRLSLVFGLHLLLETYRSFIWKTATANKINCRLQALHFAKEMKEMIQTPLPHSCDPMVGTLRRADVVYLDEYLTEKRFDLYYQCPWTAGYHMCEILHHSMDAGLRLWNSEGRVGAVLHIYNALRQLKLMDPIPLLDDLCINFQREIFLGALPTENFSSHFRRFLGGTVHTQASQTSSDTRQGRRAIGLPTRLPSANDYAKRLMPMKASLFYELHNQRFATTADFWSRLYTGKASSGILKSQLEEILKQLNAACFSEPLEKMHQVVQQEFTGPVPVACIKYYVIYALCLDILKDMAIFKLQEDGRPVDIASHALGFAFVETLLVAIVTHQRDNQLSKLLPHLASLRYARQAIMTACAGKTLAEFVWKF
ncbi:hypothetical protein EG329_002239 [Mollisiaceae sp. DMI_Dod_QoI]|nr:hypothetical protein EG329_002239 [Helotiales sp. DMI_Dod_QoI]